MFESEEKGRTWQPRVAQVLLSFQHVASEVVARIMSYLWNLELLVLTIAWGSLFFGSHKHYIHIFVTTGETTRGDITISGQVIHKHRIIPIMTSTKHCQPFSSI